MVSALDQLYDLATPTAFTRDHWFPITPRGFGRFPRSRVIRLAQSRFVLPAQSRITHEVLEVILDGVGNGSSGRSRSRFDLCSCEHFERVRDDVLDLGILTAHFPVDVLESRPQPHRLCKYFISKCGCIIPFSLQAANLDTLA